ncbi:Krueppel-like factor 6 [Cyphomyrmex costatus]|uniref:Krueppel-like factor 6 n=1 Tax=Cyphomyrmex costatus TaxID=456900 RepID=A0A195CUJ1_9HYME|nr:Krueppel-like factor 6 [Cyphomyrmex costatus]
MDTLLPSGNIFRELQDIHDTGYFSAQPSLEDHWQQVTNTARSHEPPIVNRSSVPIDPHMLATSRRSTLYNTTSTMRF